MTTEVFDILKELLSWASGIAIALVAWAYKKNEEDHKLLFAANAQTRQDTSDSHSKLMDRFMEHIEDKNRETLGYVRAEDKKLMEELSVQRSHIAKLFDKIESHAQRSEDRHRELLQIILNQKEK